MKFDIEIDDEDRPIQPKSILEPMPVNSRAIRYRLLMLFGSLLLVVVAMKEAGKPSNWEWMNFQTPQTASETGDSSNSSIELVADAEREPSFVARQQSNKNKSTPNNSNPESNQPSAKNESDAKSVNFSINEKLTFASVQSNVDYPAAATTFWNSILQKLSTKQQQDFLRLLKSMRTGQQLARPDGDSYSTLVKVIASQREKFHQDLFDRVTLLGEGSPTKKLKSDELYESTELWEKSILPALTAAAVGDDFTISQQQSIKRLQLAIDPIVFSQVADQTSIGWAGDSQTWKRLWEKAETGTADSETVDRIALMSQPEFYRGKPVKIQGWIRSIRRKNVSPKSELEFPHYYEMWVRPAETKLGTYCVYSTKLPKASSVLQQKFNFGENKNSNTTEFFEVNENVTIEGYFFKIRTYVAADSTVRSCPVVLGSSFDTIAPIEFASVERWQPTRTTLVMLLALIPIIATGIACWVYFGSRTKQYTYGKQRQKTINKTLSSLATDPNVQTDREKIMALYEPDSQDA
ncbi:MAG: hypothetical protein AB8B55_16990 [Mariniblastus sp.]